LSLKEIGIAAAANVNSLVTALGNIFGVELSFRNKATPEAIADAERTAREQRETQDKFTNNLNSAARTAQKFAIEFENLASNLLPSYSKILDVSLRLMAQFVANASGFVGGEDLSRNMRIFLGKMNENNKEYNKQLLSGMTLEGAPEQRRQALLKELESTQEISQDRLNQIRSEVEELYRLHSTKTGGVAGPDKGTDGNPLSAYSPNNPLPVTVVGGNIPSAAYGGLVSGPKSGFLAMLHGEELVIPEGGMIPVKNNNTAVASDTTATDRLVEILSAQTQKYDQMIEISNNMLRVFGDQLNTSREILNNSYT
jgi:Txe/YoeB family toxin of Txe-Axe toxin-antitoxin module